MYLSLMSSLYSLFISFARESTKCTGLSFVFWPHSRVNIYCFLISIVFPCDALFRFFLALLLPRLNIIGSGLRIRLKYMWFLVGVL